mgnify:CR=1 FL=1
MAAFAGLNRILHMIFDDEKVDGAEEGQKEVGSDENAGEEKAA